MLRRAALEALATAKPKARAIIAAWPWYESFSTKIAPQLWDLKTELEGVYQTFTTGALALVGKVVGNLKVAVPEEWAILDTRTKLSAEIDFLDKQLGEHGYGERSGHLPIYNYEIYTRYVGATIDILEAGGKASESVARVVQEMEEKLKTFTETDPKTAAGFGIGILILGGLGLYFLARR